jgi:hypothetical protein
MRTKSCSFSRRQLPPHPWHPTNSARFREGLPDNLKGLSRRNALDVRHAGPFMRKLRDVYIPLPPEQLGPWRWLRMQTRPIDSAATSRRPAGNGACRHRNRLTPPSGRSTIVTASSPPLTSLCPWDPRDFDRIAAANALSDVYAMDGRPNPMERGTGVPAGRQLR